MVELLVFFLLFRIAARDQLCRPLMQIVQSAELLHCLAPRDKPVATLLVCFAECMFFAVCVAISHHFAQKHLDFCQCQFVRMQPTDLLQFLFQRADAHPDVLTAGFGRRGAPNALVTAVQQPVPPRVESAQCVPDLLLEPFATFWDHLGPSANVEFVQPARDVQQTLGIASYSVVIKTDCLAKFTNLFGSSQRPPLRALGHAKPALLLADADGGVVVDKQHV